MSARLWRLCCLFGASFVVGLGLALRDHAGWAHDIGTILVGIALYLTAEAGRLGAKEDREASIAAFRRAMDGVRR